MQCAATQNYCASTRTGRVGVTRSATPSFRRLVQQSRRVTLARAEKPTSDKTVLKRDEEPEEFWESKAERKGNPMKDPIAIVGVIGIFFPFILLGLAAATGIIDFSAYRGN